jgi:hypothetical protein
MEPAPSEAVPETILEEAVQSQLVDWGIREEQVKIYADSLIKVCSPADVGLSCDAGRVLCYGYALAVQRKHEGYGLFES